MTQPSVFKQTELIISEDLQARDEKKKNYTSINNALNASHYIIHLTHRRAVSIQTSSILKDLD